MMSQLDVLIRNLYSNPPKHGANIVRTILSDPKLYQEWKDELKGMAGRIQSMRSALFNELTKLQTPGNWTHITSQIGMFSFTGLFSFVLFFPTLFHKRKYILTTKD